MVSGHPTKELLVLVNQKGEPIGAAPKLASHHANTPLHLAFSVHIFNDKGEVLVTQRAHSKKVWPGVWTNSCCGHPMPDEQIEDAIRRRVEYELGMTVDAIRCQLPDYRYTTPPYKGIIENEICPVFFAHSNDTPQPRPKQVVNFRWMAWPAFRAEALADTANLWSWWCKDQLKLLPSILPAKL